MNKKLISMLLAVLMVVSMFAGMTTSAYAEAVTDATLFTEHTMHQGDTVLKVCQSMGLNYYTCKNAIMKMNGFTSDSDFRFIPVGKVIYIPVSNDAATKIATVGTAVSTGTTITGTTTATPSAPAAPVNPDSVAYYLIPHIMQRGETVYSVCQALHATYNADQLQKINGLSNINNVKAGQTVLVPVSSKPVVGTSCYAVMNHKVVSGETAYTICASNSVSLNGNLKLLQGLNNKDNLNYITAGSSFYVPVPTVISAAASTGTSTGSTTGSSTGSSATAGTTSSTTATVKKYNITPNINTAYGTMSFYVDNKSVSTAKEGDVVTVNAEANNKYALSGLTVKFANGTADLKLSNNTFIMPACDVRVDASFNSGYDIQLNTNNNFLVSTTVDGIAVNSAAAGSSVRVVSNDSGYEVSNVKVTYPMLLGIKKSVTVNSGNYFVMPSKNVTVTADVNPVKTYNFYCEDTDNGSFDLQVNGFSASKAAKGAKVEIVYKAMSGYELTDIEVVKHNTTTKVNVLNNTFTMPAYDVDVKLTFATDNNSITIEAIEGGKVIATDGTDEITEAATGDTVTLTAEPDVGGGYVAKLSPNDIQVIRNSDGRLVKLTQSGNDLEFTMPAGGVTVKGKLTGDDVDVEIGFFKYGDETMTPIATDDKNIIYLTYGGVKHDIVQTAGATDTSTTVPVGTKIVVDYENRATWNLKNFKVFIGGTVDSELTNSLNENGWIIVPAATNIGIAAFYTSDDINIGAATIKGTSKATVSYKVYDGSSWMSAKSAKVGDWVKIVPNAQEPGFIVKEDGIVVTEKGTGIKLALTKDTDDCYVFEMPKNGVDITVTFVGCENDLHLFTMLKKADKTLSDKLQGEAIWGVSLDETTNPTIENIADITDGTVINNVKYKTIIWVDLTELGAADYKIDTIKIETLDPHTGSYGDQGGLTYNKNGRLYFYMPEHETRLTLEVSKKTGETASLTNISYNKDRGTVQSEASHDYGVFEPKTSCYVGDRVAVIPNAIEPYGVEFDSITVIRNSDNGKFTVTDDTTKTLADLVPGLVIPEYDGSGNVTWWYYIMPEGGVKVTVDFKVPDPKSVTFKFFNSKDATPITTLEATGALSVTLGGKDKIFDTQTTINDVEYNTSVNVALAASTAKNYKLDKITVEDSSSNFIAVSGTTFKMPGDDVTVNVYVTEKEDAEKPIALKYSCNDTKLATITFYEDSACTKAITSCMAGDTVYFKVNYDDTKYDIDLTAVGASETAGVYEFKMPANGMSIKLQVALKNAAFTLNVVKAGDDIGTEPYIQVKSYVDGASAAAALKDGDSKQATFSKDVSVSITNAGTAAKFKITHIEVKGASETYVDKDCSSTTFKMPAEDCTITVTFEAIT